MVLKGPLVDLRPFLAIKGPIKMMRNAFYFIFFVLEIFTFFVLTFWLYRKTA